MTVVVAALCNNRTAGVMAADRLLTVAGAVQMETARPKMTLLLKRAVIVAAGSYQQASVVLDRLQTRAEEMEQLSFSEIVHVVDVEREKLRGELAQKRRADLEQTVVFLRKCPEGQIPMLFDQSLTDVLCRRLIELSLSVEFLVMGRDQAGLVRLCCIEGAAGQPVFHDDLGCTAIGTGGIHALVSLQRWPSFEKFPRTVYKVYEAKKAAERANGVGVETDMVLLGSKQNAAFLPEDSLSVLEKVRQSIAPQKLPGKALATIEKALAMQL